MSSRTDVRGMIAGKSSLLTDPRLLKPKPLKIGRIVQVSTYKEPAKRKVMTVPCGVPKFGGDVKEMVEGETTLRFKAREGKPGHIRFVTDEVEEEDEVEIVTPEGDYIPTNAVLNIVKKVRKERDKPRIHR